MVQDTKIIKTCSNYLFIKITLKKGGFPLQLTNINFLSLFLNKHLVFSSKLE